MCETQDSRVGIGARELVSMREVREGCPRDARTISVEGLSRNEDLLLRIHHKGRRHVHEIRLRTWFHGHVRPRDRGRSDEGSAAIDRPRSILAHEVVVP